MKKLIIILAFIGLIGSFIAGCVVGHKESACRHLMTRNFTLDTWYDVNAASTVFSVACI